MERAVDGAIRLGRAWKALSRERRSAAIAAGVLWLTLFLPWYQASVVSRNPRTRSAAPTGESLNGWAAFSAVQALILILSLGVVLLLFLRAEGRISYAPGSDGWAITAAGALSVFLVILGLFNAPSPASRGQYVLSTGLQWGIFLALLAAVGLTWAGGRIRHSLEEDPILAGSSRSASGAASDIPAGREAKSDAPVASPPAKAPDSGRPASSSTRPAPSEPSQRSRSTPRPAEPMTEANMLGVVEPLTDETRPGAGQPLTAAGAQSPRPVRAASSGPDPVVPRPSPAPQPGPAGHASEGHKPEDLKPEDPKPEQREPEQRPAEDPTVADPPAPSSRSDWRPAERPTWNDPARPVGWLTGRSQHREEDAEDEAPTRRESTKQPEQLTIPLDPDE